MNKSFGITRANHNVSMEIRKGEVHGLIGENGSGKSTLISMISGMAEKDSGEMFIGDTPYEPSSPVTALESRIGTVVQELGLVDGLSVAANIFLGRMDRFKKLNIIDNGALYNEVESIYKKWNLPRINPRILAGSLTVEQKKIVELTRALSIDPELLILDEITAALSYNTRKILFDIMDKLKASNKSILIVTHDLEELLHLSDEITILRDGKKVTTKRVEDLTESSLKQLMVGRDIEGDYYRADSTDDFSSEVVLKLNNISDGENFTDVTLELHKGEIVGLCGLSDAGIHEVAEAVFGVRPLVAGDITLTKGNRKIHTDSMAMAYGMGYVPKDRDRQALMVSDSIENNVALSMLDELKGPFGFISPAKITGVGKKVIKDYKVVAIDEKVALASLSGGNRQKVNLGRWLLQHKDILILDSPTRGVDVGVKAYIYDIMKQLKKKGVSILLISDELPEVIGLSDTVYVFKNSKIEKKFRRSEGLTEEKIIEVML
ncbi:MAG: sugar ABC transporter ATP-binding protein [Clostridiales bacterium]|nr:sugar ABC transporter ATP-binding protein [Clostridiales bacterium]